MAMTVCLQCGGLVNKGAASKQRGRCRKCWVRWQRERDAKRGSSAQRGYDAQWRAVRRQVLARDHHVCQHCGNPASTADHLIPLAQNGPRLDPSNLVASCRSCNDARGGATRRGQG